MKVLYVSDLDGTLLHSDETLSEYTAETINTILQHGMLFSYATARSYVTASRVTKNLTAKVPLIVYNGAFIIDNNTGEVLLSNFFDTGVQALLDDLLEHEIFPIVYAMVNGKETFTYVEERCTPGMRQFVDSRGNDPRKRPVHDEACLYEGSAFYITCIASDETLAPFYAKYEERYHCVCHMDIYTKVRWLEIMPKAASKANAVRQLKELLGCDRLVVFGDGKNDADMFEIADVSCAVSNAEEELKLMATHVIASNDEDGVAAWLAAHAGEETP